MSITNLLLNLPIPGVSIELGRLVLDPKYPDQDFCQLFSQGPGDESADATNPITPLSNQMFLLYNSRISALRAVRLMCEPGWRGS
jgi:hypothetical protein